MRPRSPLLTVGAMLLLALVALPWLAAPVSADAVEEAVRRIGKQLQCPVCEGQTVADSNSGLAQEMRTVIRAQVLEGRGDQEILDSFVQSYGVGILTEPPKQGAALGVWLAPFVVLAVGLVLLGVVLARWSANRARSRPATVDLRLDAAVLDELSRFRKEVGR